MKLLKIDLKIHKKKTIGLLSLFVCYLLPWQLCIQYDKAFYVLNNVVHRHVMHFKYDAID